jgi:hypothetical protein
MSKDDDDALITAMRALAVARITGANPITRILAAASQATIELLMDAQRGDFDPHGRAVIRARLMAALAAFEDIPDDTWETWCELPKDEFFALFGRTVRAFPAEHVKDLENDG